ncbi:hypothetical protein [Polaromonas sp. YR568]|uniref:hypothetical protein n=1 Tax=Polaromonas sp. YR568 TaxID=1855301 RepID=UPI00398BD93A
MALPLPGVPRGGNGASAWRLRLPTVPAQNQLDLALGIAVFAPGISATSFVLSLGPALLSGLLHVGSPLAAGGTVCLMLMSATGVQFAVKRLSIRTVLLLGAAATALAMAAWSWLSRPWRRPCCWPPPSLRAWARGWASWAG